MKRFLVFLSIIVLLIVSMNAAGAAEVKKLHVGDDVQWKMQYLYDQCGLECLLTFEAESGLVKTKASIKQNKNGTSDWGYCQLNSQYHTPFIFGVEYKVKKKHWSNLQKIRGYAKKVKYKGKTQAQWQEEVKQAEKIMVDMSTFTPAFLDEKTQLDYCIGVFKDAKKKKRLRTTFYAFNVINKRPGVRDRFIIK